MGQKNNKKQKIILISLLTIGLAACNGGGGGSSDGSSGGDTPAPTPPAPVVYPHNGLTMSTVAVVDGVTKPVQLAKTFGHSQYYLVITNNNEETIKFSGVNYDTYFESTAVTPYNPTGSAGPYSDDIARYVMKYDGTAVIGNKTMPACLFTGESPTIYQIPNSDGIGVRDVAVSGTILAPGASCAYKLNAMWADNANETKDTFNWKMSYGIMYGESNIANPLYCSTAGLRNCENGLPLNAVKPFTYVGKDCSLHPLAPCATSSEIEAAENNQALSYYLPNHTNAISSDIGLVNVLTAAAYNTGGSNANVTNMNGDILWIPNATAASGSVSRYELQYNANTNTLTKGAFLNRYTGSNYWLMGGASSNLSGDTFYQYNYANDTNIEPLSVSDMSWNAGLDGSMYASSGNDAYGMLKVTPNGDGTYTKTKLPYLFNRNPTNNNIEAVAANGNILTADLNSEDNYCYTNTGNNTYTKVKLANSPKGQLRGVILAGVQYVWGQSNAMAGGTTYIGFDGNALSTQPTIATKVNMNTCTPDYSGFLVGHSGFSRVNVFRATNQYALSYGNGVVRVANINTVSNGADGN